MTIRTLSYAVALYTLLACLAFFGAHSAHASVVPEYPDGIVCTDGSDSWVWYVDNWKEGDPPNYTQSSFAAEADYDTVISGTPYSCSSYTFFLYGLPEGFSTTTNSTTTVEVNVDKEIDYVFYGYIIFFMTMAGTIAFFKRK